MISLYVAITQDRGSKKDFSISELVLTNNGVVFTQLDKQRGFHQIPDMVDWDLIHIQKWIDSSPALDVDNGFKDSNVWHMLLDEEMAYKIMEGVIEDEH